MQARKLAKTFYFQRIVSVSVTDPKMLFATLILVIVRTEISGNRSGRHDQFSIARFISIQEDYVLFFTVCLVIF